MIELCVVCVRCFVCLVSSIEESFELNGRENKTLILRFQVGTIIFGQNGP